MEEIKNRIELIKVFPSGTPKYVTRIESGKLVVCKNDGSFHEGNVKNGTGGWATYIGTFTIQEAEQEFKAELEATECDLDEFGEPISENN